MPMLSIMPVKGNDIVIVQFSTCRRVAMYGMSINDGESSRMRHVLRYDCEVWQICANYSLKSA